jgi:hypothetical protein
MLAAVAVIALGAGGCGSADDWSKPHAAPSAIGTLGPGFVTATPLVPESTATPSPGSWEGVGAPKGYRVVLLTAGDDQQTKTLVAAIEDWAKAEDVSLKRVTATKPSQYISRITEAIELKPDLVVSAGNGLVDPLALVTASHLEQQFLVVGAELAEPTENVTAADWTGASFRGEGLGMASTYDPASFTPERAGRAVRAGVAAVLNHLTGIVVWVD